MRYRYSGPVSGLSIKVGGKDVDIMLYPGTETDLPENHAVTSVLRALGHLEPVAKPAPATRIKKGN